MKTIYDVIEEYDLILRDGNSENNIEINIGNYKILANDNSNLYTITVWDKRKAKRPAKDYANINEEHFIEEFAHTVRKFFNKNEEEKKAKVVAIVRESSLNYLRKELPEMFEREDVYISIEEDDAFDKMIEDSEE